jgi:Flp pilus assembly protein CpaB
MKIATTTKLPKPSGIMLLNLAVLGVLALVLSNKISHEHQAEIESAVRASHKMVRAVVANRDLGMIERVRPDSCASQEAPLGYAGTVAGSTVRFE